MRLLYEGKWMREEKNFYFEGSKGKDIKVPKIISYEELLDVIHHILKLARSNKLFSFDEVCIQCQHTHKSYRAN